MTPPVTLETDGAVAVIRVDDGKANALGFDVLEKLLAALDDAEGAGAGAVAVIGRPGKFSAGFDLNVMRSERMLELMGIGTELAFRLLMYPAPVVFGVTGHALAMGAVLLCAADWRVGSRGEFKVGFNEVRIGMPLPAFACELARERLAVNHVNHAVQTAEVYDPDRAVEVGFLDEVVDPDAVADRAVQQAQGWAEALDPGAFAATRKILRADLMERLERSVQP